MSDIGHNSTVNINTLRAFVERIDRLEEEKKALGDDIKDVYLEAKGKGFECKIMRNLVALYRMDADKRKKEAAILGDLPINKEE